MIEEKPIVQNHAFESTNENFINVTNDILTLQSEVLYPFDKIALKDFGVLKDIKSAIDIGCGVGYHLKYYSELYPNTQWTGIDSNPELIKKAEEILRGKSNIQLKHTSLADYKTDKKYDAVFTCAVLQYIPDQLENYFELVTNILEPGGFLFILESESSYKIHYPRLEAAEKFTNALDGQIIKDPIVSRRLPFYMEKYGFTDIEYKPLIINQYNVCAETYFKLMAVTAKFIRIAVPDLYTEENLSEMLLLLESEERRKGFVCNLAGAYVKGIKKN